MTDRKIEVSVEKIRELEAKFRKSFIAYDACQDIAKDLRETFPEAFEPEKHENIRNAALEEAAKFIEENGWNDCHTMVNQKSQAYRFAQCIRGLKEKP